MEIDGGDLRIAPSPMNEYDWPAVEQSGAPAPGDRDLEPADIARLTSIFCGGMTNEISIEVEGKHDTGMK
jgi:hypothetical protein